MQKATVKKYSLPKRWHVPTQPTSSPEVIPETLPPKSYTPTAQSNKAQPTCQSYIAGKAVLRKRCYAQGHKQHRGSGKPATECKPVGNGPLRTKEQRGLPESQADGLHRSHGM